MKDVLVLKHNFENIKNIRSDISNIFETIKSKIQILKKVYVEMIDTHNSSEYMFGIDAFHFQNELLNTDYSNMLSNFKKIDNRMYCEYYQLYTLIRNYVETEVKTESLRSKVLINKKFPVYKVLDTNRIYKFSHVEELHDYITNTIVELESYRIAKDSELENDNKQSKQGLNIGNLVNSYRYSNALLNEKIKMFVRYLKVFHTHHDKYLKRLLVKTKHNVEIINEDIMIKQLNANGIGNNLNMENNGNKYSNFIENTSSLKKKDSNFSTSSDEEQNSFLQSINSNESIYGSSESDVNSDEERLSSKSPVMAIVEKIEQKHAIDGSGNDTVANHSAIILQVTDN